MIKQTIIFATTIIASSVLIFLNRPKELTTDTSEYQLLASANFEKIESGVYSLNGANSNYPAEQFTRDNTNTSARRMFAPAINTVAIAKFLNGNLPSTTPNGNNGVPTLLSQTGAFSNLNTLSVSPGLIPYDMIEPFWSDGATKKRWMVIPNDGNHNSATEQITLTDEAWNFPKGAVLIKHFELGGKRLETRFEVKGDDEVYYYLTYKWNDAQTDATLLNNSVDEVIVVNGVSQTWHYPSRNECASCHFPQNGSVLGPKTRNLNKSILYPSSGVIMNQLVNLSEMGILAENITNSNVSNYPAVAAKNDLSRSIEDRARTYIDVNCASCHNPTVDNVAQFDARYTTPIENQNLIYGNVIYDEGLNNPKVIIPQDVPNSMAHFRMNSTETGIEMPPLAKDVVDNDGVQLIADWINSLTPATTTPPVAAFSASTTFGAAPLSVNFDASASFDADNDPLSYSWNFGDGTTASGLTTSHVFSNTGSYTVTLTVNDGQLSDQEITTIVANNSNPGGNTVAFIDGNNLIGQDNFSGLPMGVIDMNGDGKDDIVQFNSARNLRIQYQNSGNQQFSTHDVGQVSSRNQWGTAIADFDQNGYNDIMSGGAYDNLKIIKNNNGNNSFTQSTLPSSDIFLQGANFADINNDGWADIFACHDDAESRAYQNNQNGGFTYNQDLIRTFTSPSSDNSGNYASMWMDYDNDGDLDLYISKCRGGVTNSSDPRRINMLWQNDGNNNFTEVAEQANLKIGAQTWLSDFGDIDNDGDLDAIIINHGTGPNLMRNNGNGTFTEITSGSGLMPTLDPANFYGIQGFFKDFNNDGYIDLMVSGDNHFIFYNNGDGTFQNAPNPFNSNQIQSFSVGDLNHDGFLDIYAGYAEGLNSPSSTKDRIWLNNGNANNFINVQLKGTESNINGIGARVELYGPWGKQIRDVRSGEGYGLVNTFTQHFGIGVSTTVDKVVVRWPSGTVDEISNPSINQFLVITENQVAPPLPTCDDGIQNGDEAGVDCGGSCANECPCEGEDLLVIDFENGQENWITSGNASTGTFVVADPTAQSSSGIQTQLEDDHSVVGSNAFFTATNSSVGLNDIDGGTSIATSPVYSIQDESELSLWYFFGQRNAGDDSGDFFLLEYSLDGGSSFTTLASYGDETVVAQWTEATADIPAYSNLVIRVSAADGPSTGDIVEAGIDDLIVTSICVDPVSVTGVSIDQESIILIEGETQNLAATIVPTDADNQTVSWSSSDTSIATVNTNGLVTAVSEGFATITVSTNEGNFTATSAVTVEAATIPVSGVTSNPTSVTLTEGETQLITATVLPNNADNQNVTWSSSDTSIATVNTNGLVTAVSEGSATITVSTNEGNFTATTEVTVEAATVSVTGISVDTGSVTLTEGNTELLTATIAPADADNQEVTWSSSDTSIATVDANGLVTALTEGTATITVTTNDGNFTATTEVTVEAATVSVTGISVDTGSVTLTEGNSQLLTATIAPADADNQEVTWSSSNTAIATVDSNGLVTAISEGNATITATTTDGNFTASTAVTVEENTGCVSSNVALTGNATQSSTYGNGIASYAIDGNTTGESPWSADLQHTGNEFQPWWAVDLGADYSLDNIKIFNRTNRLQTRLNDFYVLVSDTPFASESSLDDLLNDNRVEEFFFLGDAGLEETISLQTEGRYLRIQLEESGILHMAEVEVIGCFLQTSPCDGIAVPSVSEYGPYLDSDGIQTLVASPAGGTWSGATTDGTFDPGVGEGTYEVTYTYDNGLGCVQSVSKEIIVNTSGGNGCILTNLALYGIATQSSTYGNGAASYAINGNTVGTDPWSANLQHTNNEFQPWWQIDLGADYSLENIKIFNRTNRLQSRLNDFYVLVSDTPFDMGSSLDDLINDNTIQEFFFFGEAGLEESISLQTEGRYVRIQLEGNGILHMAEVEINVCNQSGPTPFRATLTTLDINLVPNPATDFVTITVDTVHSNAVVNYTLYSSSGVQVLATQGSAIETINISTLPQGVYTVIAQIGADMISTSLIVR